MLPINRVSITFRVERRERERMHQRLSRTGSRRATSSLSARRKLAAVFASSATEDRKEKEGRERRERARERRTESGTLGVSSGWSNYPTVSRSRAARAGPGNKTLSFKAEAKPVLSPGPPRF